jgi:Mg-chelatase subunit ChlD
MSLHIASSPKRLLVALLCVQISIGGAGAAEVSAAAIFARKSSQEPQRTQNRPNFQPPSAANCARPVQTAEIPGAWSNARGESRDRSAYFIGDTVDTLRGLDPAFGSRTLTMIDGRRVVSSSSATDVADLSEVMVTGARVVTPGAASTNPIESINGEEMRRLGVVNVADALVQLVPQNVSAYPPSRVGANAPSMPVTAGMVDDNADFSEYLAFRNRTRVAHRERDISERYLLQVRDARGAVVSDAEVSVHAPGGAALWARTDTGGRVWLHPRAFDTSQSTMYEVTVRKNGHRGTGYLQRGQKSAVDVVIKNPDNRHARAQLDLVFLIDATGSMADEILKLKTTLHAIAAEVAALPSHPDTCFGLVAYRDTTDDFVVRRHDFTNDLDAFQGVLNALQANGGGDYPEAMNEALAETVHRLSWRGTDTTRLVVLLADAPPHLDYNTPQYDDSMVAALGKGIKVLSVGASGLDKQGEYIQRQIAQYTGGRFVFLTYRNAANPASGPGRETVHDVNDYSVQTLDRLIVRLVAEELEKLPRGR